MLKIGIVYYSYSGNTHRVAEILKEILARDNAVDTLRIEALDESKNFFAQVLRALMKKRATIKELQSDLSEYDLLFFGSPVWAREMPPAMHVYLEKVKGLERKKIVSFVTYGSGLGKTHCLDSMEQVLKQKGATEAARFSLNQMKNNDRTLIGDLVKDSLKNLSVDI